MKCDKNEHCDCGLRAVDEAWVWKPDPITHKASWFLGYHAGLAAVERALKRGVESGDGERRG